MSRVTETGSEIPTLDASNLSYQFERVNIDYPEIKSVSARLSRINESKAIPKNLAYLDDFYDKKTGTSGTAFEVNGTKEVIVAYTGTNPEGDFFRDAGTDFNDIFLGKGGHYDPATHFYEEIAEQYGKDNITLTGHSLGGNIAQRVALKYDVPNTVIYNAAPLYIPMTTNWHYIKQFQQQVEIGQSDLGAIHKNISSIESDMKKFTGKVIRITTMKDFLNPGADSVEGIYIGKEYFIAGSGDHGLDAIINDEKQISQLEALFSLQGGILENIKLKMSVIATLQTTLSVGGTSQSEMIYLDGVQAKAVAKGLVTAAENGDELVKASAEAAIEEAESLYKTCQVAPSWASLLSDAEAEQAYHDGGATRDAMVTNVKELFEKKTQVSGELVEIFTGLVSSINEGISELEGQDSELAGLIRTYG
ncbi:alpha/beta hydrolase [Streptococcus pluranimalium]|uniref:DUF2974 domain-containing protein n=1 Tax=Streptococcus pluranimalium TaxID=82348 RepID=A0A2L0D414_9STRE|nr:alpha/beta hydrolase [Streptococcus pluranimalium]AUW96311.1 hypothetical protein C0J00_03855 [Streptococcus pluranimalium]